MTWKKVHTAILVLLAVCVGGVVLLCLIGGMGYTLVVGQVDSGKMIWALVLIFLLVTMIWADGGIVESTKGWARWVSLAAAVFLEGTILMMILLVAIIFGAGGKYAPLYKPSGEVGLVVREESWFFDSWGEFYLPVGPCLLRGTGVAYSAHDIWPFSSQSSYEMEWGEGSVIIRYNNGMGEWETRTVPLN